MIPKKAHFYWYGDGPMHRLREAAIDTFRKHNPDWAVHVHHSGNDPNATFRQKAIASDAARYAVLHRAGGMYFDTDIAFIRPVPEAWLGYDLVLPCTELGAIYGVHCLGAKEGSSFFGRAVEMAQARLSSDRLLGCQSLGIKLWQGVNVLQMAADAGEKSCLLPYMAFLTTSPANVEDLWNDRTPPRPSNIGIHWYGGDRLSQEFEDYDPKELPESALKRALL